MKQSRSGIWSKHRVALIVTLITAMATLIAAFISIIPQLKTSHNYDLTVDTTYILEAEKPFGLPQEDSFDGPTATALRAPDEDDIIEYFSDIGVGWDLGRYNYLQQGELHIFHEYPNNAIHTCLNLWRVLPAASFDLEVDARQISGPLWSYGLVFKIFSSKEMVFFSIRRDGMYKITRLNNGEWHDYSDWKRSPVPIGKSKVRLHIRGYHDEIAFSLDDAEVSEFIENIWRGKYLCFGMFSSFDIHAAFDNFEARNP